jgi:hypothetical protein
MKRPLAVTIIGWLFIAAGTVGFLYHIQEITMGDPFADDTGWVLLVRILAIVSGILILRGTDAGRWLLVVWMAYHVVLGYFHTLSELVMHAILLAAVTYALFHPRSAAFFKRVRSA